MKIRSMEKYAKVFIKHSKNPLMQKIGRGKTGFVRELENFYGVYPERTGGRGGLVTTFRLNESKGEEPSKIGTSPRYLIEILEDFQEVTIPEDRLEYLYVRNDVQPPDTEDIKVGRRILKGTAVAVAGVTISSYYLTNSFEITGAVMSLVSLTGALVAMPFLNRSSPYEKIFPVLFYAAEKADSFKEYYIAHKIIESCKDLSSNL